MLPREIDRIFDDVFVSGDNESARSVLWSPQAYVYETDDRYIVRMDIRGLSKKDLDIKLQNDVLSVSGERKRHHETDTEAIHQMERGTKEVTGRASSGPRSASLGGVLHG